VSVAAGSDAPFGSEDPWRVMRAAVRRAAPFRPDESVSPARALALFLGEPAAPAVQRQVAPGQPADLTLLRAGPREMLRTLSPDLVAVTFIGGEFAYARD
jgi:predicted amidohydrolase YtcJ